MNRIRLLAGMLLFAMTAGVYGQSDSVYTLSLDQAQSFAIENNLKMKNASLDVRKAKKKILETTAMGLPHVEAKGAYSYMMTLASTLETFAGLGQIGGAMYGFGQNLTALNNMSGVPQLIALNENYAAIAAPSGEETNMDDYRTTATLDISASQLIFNGSYLIGLQASKVYKSLSELSYEMTKNDVIENVTNSYVLVLVIEQNKKILDSTYKNTLNLYRQFLAMNKAGFISASDTLQFRLTLQTIKNLSNTISRQQSITRDLLNFQLGANLSDSTILTDDLEKIITNMRVDALQTPTLSNEKTLTFQMMETQVRLAKLNVKLKKSAALPSIVAFYNHQENFNDKSFSFTPPDMIGASLSIPIFSSFERSAKHSQAKIDLEQTINSRKMAMDGLNMQYNETNSGYQSAIEKYLIEKDNLKLSTEIFQQTVSKYKEGVSTSMELTQAQNQYLNNQSNYFKSIMELVSAKMKLDKVLNNYNK